MEQNIALNIKENEGSRDSISLYDHLSEQQRNIFAEAEKGIFDAVDNWLLADRNGRTIAHEAARKGKLPKNFDQWSVADKLGWSVAHEAAKYNTLPQDFNQWGIREKFGWTVAHCVAQKGNLPNDFKEWGLRDFHDTTVREIADLRFNETYQIYESGNKFIPVNQSNSNAMTIYSELRQFSGKNIESGSIKLQLDFARGYKDEDAAIESAREKWGSEINLESVLLNREFFVIFDQNEPVAVKEAFFDAKDGSFVQEQNKILKQGRLGKQDPAYAMAMVDSSLKTGNFTQKACSRQEFNELQRSRIIPLPSILEIDLIAERQSRYGEQTILPEADNNIVGRAAIEKDIMLTEDWIKAKAGNREAAGRIIDILWSSKKTEKFLEMTGNQREIAFITMPSSSGFNVLPQVFADKLVRELGGRGQILNGDEYFNVLHAAEIKNISRFDRIFMNRKYQLEKSFEKDIEGKKIVLLDDIFTTGGSVKGFSSVLAENGLHISHVAGLMGDKRLRVDEKTADALKKALNDTGIDVDINRLRRSLTRTEAGLLTQTINREGIKNDKRAELTGKIHGLYKRIFVRDITGDRDTGRDKSPGRAHPDNAKDAKRVQDRGSRGQGR